MTNRLLCLFFASSGTCLNWLGGEMATQVLSKFTHRVPHLVCTALFAGKYQSMFANALLSFLQSNSSVHMWVLEVRVAVSSCSFGATWVRTSDRGAEYGVGGGNLAYRGSKLGGQVEVHVLPFLFQKPQAVTLGRPCISEALWPWRRLRDPCGPQSVCCQACLLSLLHRFSLLHQSSVCKSCSSR